MQHLAEPNLVLESLAYLGARANGGDLAYLEKRFLSKGCRDVESLRRQFAPVQRLQQRLDRQVKLPEKTIRRLFVNLNGFFENASGAYSPALMIFSPMACHCSGDVEEFLAAMKDRTPDQVAQDILLSLDLNTEPREGISAERRLLDSILAASLPAESRLALLEIQQNYAGIYEETACCLRETASVMKTLLPELKQLAYCFGEEVEALGAMPYFRTVSGFPMKEEAEACSCLRPLIMAPSSNLLMEREGGGYAVYCGILRYFLSVQLREAESSLNQIYESIRLLGDRTRFDIFCYLLDHSAYGQELSERFGLARNTIHHHMSKLYDAGLVNCTVEGSKVYYSADKAHYRSLLEQQRRLLLRE